MSLHKTFKTDHNLEIEGVWLEYGHVENADGTPDQTRPIRILVARAGGANVAFQKALEKATKPHRTALRVGTMSNSSADNLYKEVFASTVLKGWINVQNAAGDFLEFSKENALAIFEELPDLYADIRDQATAISIFRETLIEEDVGNSGTSSATGSSKGRSNKK